MAVRQRLRPRLAQPQDAWELARDIRGFVGSYLLGAAGGLTGDGQPLTLAGGATVAPSQQGPAYQGDGTDNIAYATPAKNFVFGTDKDFTLVIVARKRTAGVNGSGIAGFGATGGGVGNTQFALFGSASNSGTVRIVAVSGDGTVYLNTDATAFGWNDLQWHTIVVRGRVAHASSDSGGATYFADGFKLNTVSGLSDTNPPSTTFNVLNACAVRRGGSTITAGPYDVALCLPLIGTQMPDEWCARASSLATVWQACFEPQRTYVPFVTAGDGTTQAIGQASETDTAHPITANQARAAGLQSEADSALPITARSTIAAGQPSETDAALPIAAAQTITLGLPSETDTAQAVTPSAPGTLGLQQETDTALPMAAGQARTLGLQSEVDSALGITSLQARTLGEPAEVDAALPMTVVVPSVGLGLPIEGDTALPMTVIGASTSAAPDYALPRAPARRKKVTVIHKDDTAEREAEFQELLARVKGQGSTKGRAAAKRAATGPLDASAQAFEPASIPRMPEVTGVPADALRRWMPELLAAFRVEYRTGYADQLQGLMRAAAHNRALIEDEEEVAILAALL